ncbi:hypothetical protein A1OS_15495 [Enterovibrio norvegicus]|uniref:tetratricopeptide repeat protein n=1 Tax=Enterovibrio norvegicus TaxID=188144 RepID=UPI0003739767|nr:hypothetical protein [Enterovibrio norvegicus]OEE65033.1 hypothetical protein A1OS_15495 [Enterovibrio norvegicus]
MQYLELFSTEELLALAALDLEKEQLDQGLQKLKYLTKQSVVSDELDSMLGSVYAKLRLFDSAAEHYALLLDRTPSRLHERFQLGMVYREMNELEKAAECWDVVLKEDGTYPPVLFHKALLHLTIEDVSESKTLLNKLIASADSDNYYVERARNVLEDIKLSESEPKPTTSIDQVH